MILGPPEIINCPFCNTSFQKLSLVSGNTFGGVQYSDGQHYYPMLPDQPEITVCDSCGHFFWIKDVKSIEDMSESMDADDLPYLRWPENEEWIQAISKGIFRNNDEEIYLRTHLWWILNNKFRMEERTKPGKELFQEQLYIENLQALLRLRQSEETPDLLLMAEICRELGFFEEALDLLKHVKDEHLKDISDQIRKKARQRNPYMFKLT